MKPDSLPVMAPAQPHIAAVWKASHIGSMHARKTDGAACNQSVLPSRVPSGALVPDTCLHSVALKARQEQVDRCISVPTEQAAPAPDGRVQAHRKLIKSAVDTAPLGKTACSVCESALVAAYP